MLNAFRHQRFDTSSDDDIRTKLVVLNAFRHQRFDTDRCGACFSGGVRAQRLSASEIRHVFTLDINYIPLSECSTPFGIRDSTHSSVVIKWGHNPCSTPFGIRDSTQIVINSVFPSSLYVLNAFRHQRFDTCFTTNTPVCIDSAQRLSASEIRHINKSPITRLCVCAQRLSASEIRHKRRKSSTKRK